MSRAWELATAVTALGAAATGGAFLTYSTFTTAGLRRLSDADAMAAMQQINLEAPRSVSFMVLLFVPGLAGLVLAARALLAREPGSLLVLAGVGVYVVGVVGVTVAFNVPRNDTLAALDAATQHDGWRSWLSGWVAGNHVRIVSGLLAAALLVGSLLLPYRADSADRASGSQGSSTGPGPAASW
ncbi:anthrone oxygenase family protein [Nocardioides sp. GXZ039]|uniref:anthrone oxygenase family protein n=1 Tax=Nocardioides sp. GXZ039 TaxID=3136018 RepID=UPI0030F3A001